MKKHKTNKQDTGWSRGKTLKPANHSDCILGPLQIMSSHKTINKRLKSSKLGGEEIYMISEEVIKAGGTESIKN